MMTASDAAKLYLYIYTCGPEPMQILENSASSCEIKKLTLASNGSDDFLVGLLSAQLWGSSVVTVVAVHAVCSLPELLLPASQDKSWQSFDYFPVAMMVLFGFRWLICSCVIGMHVICRLGRRLMAIILSDKYVL